MVSTRSEHVPQAGQYTVQCVPHKNLPSFIFDFLRFHEDVASLGTEKCTATDGVITRENGPPQSLHVGSELGHIVCVLW